MSDEGDRDVWPQDSGEGRSSEAEKDKLGWQSDAPTPPAGASRFGRALLALIAVAVILGVGYVVVPEIPGLGSDEDGKAGFRSCIARVFADEPECSDGPGGNGELKDTVLNGRDLGKCRQVSNDGCIAR